MEKLLTRLARQLDAMDEASLIHLWNKYANIASRFEPTKRWEESVLIFALIQAKHWKNQLFNYNFSRMSKPLKPSGKEKETPQEKLHFDFSLEKPSAAPEKSHCRVLSFPKRADINGTKEGTGTPADRSPSDE